MVSGLHLRPIQWRFGRQTRIIFGLSLPAPGEVYDLSRCAAWLRVDANQRLSHDEEGKA